MAIAKDFCDYINNNYSPFIEMRISEKYISDIKKESNDIIDIRIYSDWLNDYVGIGTIDWQSFEITLASDWLNYGIFTPVWTGDIIEMMLCDSEFTDECFDVNQYSIFTFINNLEDKTYNETVKTIIEHVHDSLVDSLFFKQFCYYVVNNLYYGIDQEIEILKECLESCSASLKHNSFKNTIKVEKYEQKKKILVVIDMQNDFVTGVLGTPEAQAIVPKVVGKIKANNYDRLVFTYDTHNGNYLQTREGRHLPVPHCQTIKGEALIDEFDEIFDEKLTPWFKGKEGYNILIKENFALEDNIWREFVHILNQSLDMYVSLDYKGEDLEFELIGVCTDICVVSNAFAIRQAFPEAEITIDASCCAGTTPELHRAALMTMKSCQMNIINEDI